VDQMGDPIRVDLERAQQCTASDMIQFLLAFCRPCENGTAIPVHDEEVLGRAFEAAKEIANDGNAALRTNISHLYAPRISLFTARGTNLLSA
jgi:hypothetical protein